MPLNKYRKSLVHLLDWCDRDKGMLVALLIIALELFFSAWLLLTHWYTDFGDAYFNPRAVRWLLLVHIGAVAGWFVLFLIGDQLRRKQRDPRWFLALVVNFYSISLVPQGYIFGLLTPLVGIILLGSALVGFVLFDFFRVIVAFVFALALIAGISVLTIQDRLDYAPLFVQLPVSKGDVSPYWALSQLALALPFVVGAFSLNQMLLARWRDRERSIRRLSLTDELTGLSNRRSIMKVIEHEFARSERDQTSLTLVMLDLDHFKQINDLHGHGAGDEILKRTADVLRESIRDTDWAGRYGGEEFVLVLPRTEISEAVQVVERCRQTIEALEIPLAHGKVLSVTASFGLHEPRLRTEALEQALQCADQALYEAKAAGRNQYRLWSATGTA